MTDSIFPPEITSLPKIDIPGGVTIYLTKSESHTVYYLTAAEDLPYPEHAHAAQLGIVLEGKMDITTDAGTKTYCRGDRYYLPAGTRHWGTIYAGFAEMSYLDDPKFFG